MPDVFRVSRVHGSVIGPPFHGYNLHRGLWAGPSYQPTCTWKPHKVPDPACQCGVWGAPEPGPVAQFVRDQTAFDDRLMALCGPQLRTPASQARFRRQIAESGDQAAAHMMSLDAPVVRRLLRTMHWEDLAVIRATGDDDGVELRRDGAGRDPRVIEQRIRQFQLFYGCDRTRAVEMVSRVDYPVGYRRYGTLTVRQIWLDQRWADYRAELQQRYDAQVVLVAVQPGGRFWVDRFAATAQLPGRSSPRPRFRDPSVVTRR